MPERAKTEERKELEVDVINLMMDTLSKQEIAEYVTGRLSDDDLKTWLGLDGPDPSHPLEQ